MSDYLVGFKRQQGQFYKGRKLIKYNSRILYFVSDKAINLQGHYGYDIKVKMSDIAYYLGVDAVDDVVDKTLTQYFGCNFKFAYARTSNGGVTLAGLIPDKK